MPHYKNGIEARVGDQVTGKLLNTDGVRAGTVISITPGADHCNAKVQFSIALPIVDSVIPKTPRMYIPSETGSRVIRGHHHGDSGPEYVVFTCADYADVHQLTKIE